MKKRIIIFISIAGILLLIYLIFIISISSPKREQINPTITPAQEETSQNIPAPSIPPEMKKEKELEGNYALERQKFLEDKPWILKLPLESDHYFISYDIEKEKFIVTIYFYKSSEIPKNQQIIQARKEALEALNKENVNFFKEDVEFVEFERN